MGACAVVLFAVSLPAAVASPGAGRVAAGLGLEARAPVVDLRIGVHDLIAVLVDATWHPKAPLLGTQVRIAAGRSRDAFAAVWVEGHLRPVLTDQVKDAVAGGDAGLGVGAVVRGGDLSVGMDGGVSLGVPVGDHQLKDLDPTRVDQQGGLFGVQRLWLGYDLGEHVGLLGNAGFALPIQSVRYNRRSEEVLGTWDVRLGARLVVRL
jgi:hypothetical protein